MTRNKKSASSKSWAARQKRDPFVRSARQHGYRARAVYKLAEIDAKHRLLKPGACVVDLGAAPGSWSQYAAGKGARVVAVDLLAMAPVANVTFVQGDFTDAAVADRVVAAVAAAVTVERAAADADAATVTVDPAVTDPVVTAAASGRGASLVLSDLAPNLSGISDADQARMAALQDAVLEFCRRALVPGGALLTKLFAGNDADAVRARLNARFAAVKVVKPDASRAASREIYVLARGHTGVKTAPK